MLEEKGLLEHHDVQREECTTCREWRVVERRSAKLKLAKAAPSLPPVSCQNSFSALGVGDEIQAEKADER